MTQADTHKCLPCCAAHLPDRVTCTARHTISNHSHKTRGWLQPHDPQLRRHPAYTSTREEGVAACGTAIHCQPAATNALECTPTHTHTHHIAHVRACVCVGQKQSTRMSRRTGVMKTAAHMSRAVCTMVVPGWRACAAPGMPANPCLQLQAHPPPGGETSAPPAHPPPYTSHAYMPQLLPQHSARS